ncbi:hypothetical protein [Streptomyces pseudogriseolus]|uniref:hypothetical protein n=1 Tax=Streptomyces pseudogriseolus TaxID=36817 RepID=UPI003FA24647
MHSPELSLTRVRILLGSLSLALFAQTAFWLMYDVVVQGIPDVWSVWATGTTSGLSAATSLDLGLAALQLAAGSAALLRVRGAGGLLVIACAATVAFRAPVVWYLLLDSPTDPWFGGLEDPSLAVVGTTCIVALVISLAQACLLLRARQLEHEAAAREAALTDGSRPVKVTATASCVLLSVLNCFYICRNALTAVDVGPGVLADLLVGKGAGRAVLGVSSPWQWTCLIVMCGVGMVLAGKRRPIATGFSLGLAVLMMPTAFAKLWGAAASDTLLDTPLGTLQSLVELIGSAAVLALITSDLRNDARPELPDGSDDAEAAVPAGTAPATPRDAESAADVAET